MWARCFKEGSIDTRLLSCDTKVAKLSQLVKSVSIAISQWLFSQLLRC